MILWLNPVTGISGDMLLGALLDLGAPLEAVREAVAGTGLGGWTLRAEQVRAGGLVATQAVVTVTDTATERPAAELLDLVRRTRPAPVAELAARAVSGLATVEARLHGEHPDRVHLHEIGGLDTAVDTVGVAAALHLLGVTAVHCAPLPMAAGTVTTRHGTLPAPAPATLALLTAAGAPVTGTDLGPGTITETVTPTGAALLVAAAARFGPVPPMAARAAGYGAGSRVLPDRANVLQALLGDPLGVVGQQVLLETNVDDVTGETLGHLVTAALAAGAADAWVSPVVMKKGRPAHTVHVLAPAERVASLERLVFAETGTLGLRRTVVDKVALQRGSTSVEVDGQRIGVKRGPWGAKPEHDDVVAAAAALGLSTRMVTRRALEALPEL